MRRELLFLSTLLPLAGCAPDDEEDTDDGDEDDDGDVEVDVELAWSADVDGPTSNGLVSALDFVFVVTDDGEVTGMYADSGDAWWTNTIELVGDLTWMLGGQGQDGTLLALPDQNGVSLFQVYGREETRGWVTLDGEGTWDSILMEQNVGDVNYLYEGNSWGYANKCEWTGGCTTHQVDDVATTAPAGVGQDLLMVTTRRLHRVTASSSDDATFPPTKWSTDLGFAPVHGPVVHDDYAVLSSPQGDLLVVDVGTGKKVWSFDLGSAMEGSVTVDGGEGLVLAAGDDGVVHALSLEDGDEQWTFEATAGIVGGVDTRSEEVAVASVDGMVVVLDIEDGQPIWSYDTGARLLARPVMDGSVVVVLDDQGQVFGIEGS